MDKLPIGTAVIGIETPEDFKGPSNSSYIRDFSVNYKLVGKIGTIRGYTSKLCWNQEEPDWYKVNFPGMVWASGDVFPVMLGKDIAVLSPNYEFLKQKGVV